MLGFQKRSDPSKWTDVSLPIIKHGATEDHQAAVICSCGWIKRHDRYGVRDRAASAHLSKRHGGVGIYL